MSKLHKTTTKELSLNEEMVTAEPVIDDKGRVLLKAGVPMDEKTVKMLKRMHETTKVVLRNKNEPEEAQEEYVSPTDTKEIDEKINNLKDLFRAHVKNPIMVALLRAEVARITAKPSA
ncbi:MAG: hypothetical protein NUW37_15295 [Planctomycetes bacterium]|nr:hypothetical protein [Planctomycetota bacterium]